MFETYLPGDRLLEGNRLWEVTKEARTPSGALTYRVQSLDGEKERWIGPRPKDERPSVIDRSAIRMLVERFYGAIADDPVLGPIFERRVHGDWGPHLDKMVRFWSAVLLREAGYDGSPPVAHRAIEELSPEHFAHWLELFQKTAAECFEEEASETFASTARGIARGLSTAVLGAPWNTLT